jgi:uncharacterized protein YkwD
VAELAALAVLLGSLAVAGAWGAASLVAPGSVAVATAGVACGLLGAVGLKAWRRHVLSLHGHAGGLPLLAVGAAAAALGAWLPMAWDGAFVWQLKTRAVVLAGGLPWEYLADASRGWSHPGYPLLVPLVRAWLAGGHESLGNAAGALFLVAAAGLLLGPAARWLGLRVATTALVGVLAVPLVWVGAGSVASGYADLPLAAFYLGAVVYLLAAAASAAPGDLSLAAWLAAGLPWVKTEGALLWACWLALAVVALGPRRWRELLAIAAPGVATWTAWRLVVGAADAVARQDYEPSSPGLLLERLHLAPEILAAAGQRLTDAGVWTAFWPLVAIAAIPWRGGVQARACGWLGLAVALPAGLYLLPYFFSRWTPVTLHVESSFDRLLLHLVPVAALLLAVRTVGAWATLRAAWAGRATAGEPARPAAGEPAAAKGPVPAVLGVIVTLALGLATPLATAAAQGPAIPDSRIPPADATGIVLAAVNAERLAAGLDPLAAHPALAKVAAQVTKEALVAGLESTESTDPMLLSREIRKAGYQVYTWRRYVVQGPLDVRAMVAHWRGTDPAHFQAVALGDFEVLGAARGGRPTSPVWTVFVALPRITSQRRLAAPLDDAAAVRTTILRQVNAERAAQGLAPVTLEARLIEAAQGHADDMRARLYYDHLTPEGSGPADRAFAAGYRWRWVAENIAKGLFQRDAVVERWMASSGHRLNILNARASQAGIGVAWGEDRDGHVSAWWVLLLAAPG